MSRVLTFDTLIERPTVAIDGVEYDMALPDDFGILALAKIDRMQRDLGLLMARPDDLTDRELERIAGILDGLTALVLPDVPDERRGRLRDAQKLAVVQAFQREMTSRRTPSQTLNPPTSAP